MADISEEKNMQEIYFLEQNYQNLMFQKQSFQAELSETEAALKEIGNSKDDVFKVIGDLMIKGNKDKIKEELEEKMKILEMRINSIERQENLLIQKLEKMKK